MALLMIFNLYLTPYPLARIRLKNSDSNCVFSSSGSAGEVFFIIRHACLVKVVRLTLLGIADVAIISSGLAMGLR